MRIFHIHSSGVTELTELPAQPPAQGFLWIAVARPAFQARLLEIQSALQSLVGLQLVDLHVSDLLNAQLPSHYDYTSQYDLLVFRRLATANASVEADDENPGTPQRKPTGPLVLRRLDTSPVGFAVFDHVLLTVHPSDCTVREAYASKLLATAPGAPGDMREGRANPLPGSRLPASPALRKKGRASRQVRKALRAKAQPNLRPQRRCANAFKASV